MSGKLDIAKVEAALQRAAQTAVHGSREARSGRFTAQNSTIPVPTTTDKKKER